MGDVLGATAVWINVANVVYLASYAVHDILWLRILTVVAAVSLVPYYLFQPTPLWTPIIWNGIFVAINAYWIVRLLLERRPVRLTADERRLRELAFPSLTAREALNLYRTGRWEDLAPGASIVQHDKSQQRLSVILRGIADVLDHGEAVGELGEGQFVGEIDTRADSLTGIDVVVRTRMRVMCWPRAPLEAFLKSRPDVALALERSIGLQLRHRLDEALVHLRERSSQ